MSQRPSGSARRAGLLAVAFALAAALVAAAGRLRRAPSPPRRRVRAVTGRFRRSAHETYKCGCGTKYRVSGAGRHRVYWPAAAPEDEPVLGDRCVECDAPLPGGPAIRTA
jgi:hypothetical protein